MHQDDDDGSSVSMPLLLDLVTPRRMSMMMMMKESLKYKSKETYWIVFSRHHPYPIIN